MDGQTEPSVSFTTFVQILEPVLRELRVREEVIARLTEDRDRAEVRAQVAEGALRSFCENAVCPECHRRLADCWRNRW